MNRFNNFSIKSKIVAIIIFVTFIAVVIGLFVIGTRDYKQQQSSLVSNLLINTKLVSDNCIVPLSFGDIQRAQEILSTLKNVAAIDQGILLDIQGNVFAQFPIETIFNETILKLDTLVWKRTKNQLQIVQPIYFNNDFYGTLVINADTLELKTHLSSFIKFSLLIIILLVTLAFILAARMQMFISGPILKLGQHFRNLAKNHDYSVSLTKQNNDEIGDLYDGFNELMSEIQKRSKERDKAEVQLKLSKEKLDLALAGGEIGIWEWDLKTDITIWDERMEKMFGIKLGTFGQDYENFKACLHPDDIIATEDAINNALENNIPYDILYRSKWRNGEIRYINAKATVIRNTKGKPTKMLGVCIDITEFKRAEFAKLNSEKKFRALVEQSLTGIYVFEKDNFQYVNNRFCEIFGFSSEEVLANLKPADVLIETERERVNENIQKRLSGEVESVRYTARGNHKDGRLLWVEIHGTHVKIEGKDVITGTVLDITERKVAEEEIKKLNSELEEKVVLRTKELEKKYAELEKMNKIFVGRELRMVELKKKIQNLEKLLK